MTDRIHGFTVVLDRDIRDDDVAEIETALKMVKGVADVAPVIRGPADQVARIRIRHAVEARLHDAVTHILNDNESIGV